MIPFQKITILGGGLLGGSAALACPTSHQAMLWSRREEASAEARSLGIHATSDLVSAVQQADLLILCVPVGHMAALLQQAIDAGLPTGCVVTDVGSVKRQPHDTLRPLLQSSGLRFIGSHPMAGGEKQGIAHARSTLFENAACLLTNDENVESETCQALEQFWQSLGCRTAWGTAEEHDAIVARVSHLPHVLACFGALVALKQPGWGQYCGNGLRDTTRVASGSPSMWAEILLENRDQIRTVLEETRHEIDVITAMLEANDRVSLEHWLAEAKERRDGLSR